MPIDYRHIANGYEIPSEGYCDQPYVVINDDGSWTCLLTTGRGDEGEGGQHVVATISEDQGRTWSDLYDIEPSDGPEASWVMPLRVPSSGRIYAFYTYNKENQREVQTVDQKMIARVDSLGVFAYKYSDDRGRTWSEQRYEIPMRQFECDRQNVYQGKVSFFWSVGKPFIHRDAAYICSSKVGGFGRGFFVQNEGVLFRSTNLLTEHDPSAHEWETLPEGDIGLRTPPGGGPIAGEFNATPMNDGSLYGTFRTIDGWACHAYSRDDGRHWEIDWMTYKPNGRRVKNPRSANFVRRFSNGKYLYWFCFNGGEMLGRNIEEMELGYMNRNPIFMCGGIEKDGRIHWSEPEVVLYDPKVGNRMSYPDYVEDQGRIFITETQKTVARVHELDPKLLDAMWSGQEDSQIATEGLVLDLGPTQCQTEKVVDMPALPPLYTRGSSGIDAGTGATLNDNAFKAVKACGGFAIEFWLQFDSLTPWQVLFDSRGDEGCGLFVQLTDQGTIQLQVTSRAYDTPGSWIGNGVVTSACECDQGLLKTKKPHQVLFIVDGGPKLMTVMVDGVLCDGGSKRQFGWSRFHPNLMGPNGADQAKLAPSLDGELISLRLYNRYLLANEGAGNYRANLAEMQQGTAK